MVTATHYRAEPHCRDQGVELDRSCPHPTQGQVHARRARTGFRCASTSWRASASRPAVGSRPCRRRAPDALNFFVYDVFCCCPADRTCPLHRLNRPADGCAANGLCRRFAYFLPQPIRCLPFGLPRLRRAQLRVAPPAGKKQPGGEGSWPVTTSRPTHLEGAQP